MKLVSKMGLTLSAITVLFLAGCNYNSSMADKDSAKPSISEESLGLRKVDLYTEDKAQPYKTEYAKDYAGSGKTINRAFQDAPPMIPHDTEGMLPITIDNNQCVGCHMPEVAASVNATPVPKSHFTDFRPMTSIAKDGKIVKDGKEIVNTSSAKLENISIKEKNQLVGARFNCSQCHAPQSVGGTLVQNTFEPEFTSEDGAKKSSWKGNKFTDSLNTLGDLTGITDEEIANKDSKAGTLEAH